MERLGQGHLHPLLEHLKWTCPGPGLHGGGEHSSKELIEQLMLLLLGTSGWLHQSPVADTHGLIPGAQARM
jgi:hypothetical protein